MWIQGENLRTPNAVTYLQYVTLLSKLSSEIKDDDCSIMPMDNFACEAVLCHGSLSMDHIIVNGDVVVGIVGWKKCDFIPEVMDRIRYHFARPQTEGETWWYHKLSVEPLRHYPPPASYIYACARYCYCVRLRSTPEEYHSMLRLKMGEFITVVLVSTSMASKLLGSDITREEGDHGSQGDHHNQASPFSDVNRVIEDLQAHNTIYSQGNPRYSDISGWSEDGTVQSVIGELISTDSDV
jgi:hypothetical protein